MQLFYRRRATFALVGLVVLGFQSNASAQVDVAASAGTATANYTTLKSAFDAINAGTHQGAITIGISGNTTETASAMLNASGSGGSAYTAVTIHPTGGAMRTISGSVAGPLIGLNGADNVTIDGLNDGTNGLTIANTSTSSVVGTSTILLFNDATSNLITNAVVLGSATGDASQNLSGSLAGATATILFAGTTGTSGNDNNTISYCRIADASAGLPTVAVGSRGQSAAQSNDNILVTGNKICNFYGALGSNGINIASNSSDWTISFNFIFQESSRSGMADANFMECVYINTPEGYHTIQGNYMGYASASLTGMLVNTGGKFVGIDIAAVDSVIPTDINDNKINGIDWTTGNTDTGAGVCAFSGIIARSGRYSIGSTQANYIGSSAAAMQGTGISLHSTGAVNQSLGFTGIYTSSAVPVTIANNFIGGIYSHGDNATTGTTFYGITILGTGSPIVRSNSIGGGLVGSIVIGDAASQANSTVFGVFSMASGALMIGGSAGEGNIIQNFTLNASGNSAFMGINLIGNVATTATIKGNLFQGLTFSAAVAPVHVQLISVVGGSESGILNIQDNIFESDAFNYTGTTGGNAPVYAINNMAPWGTVNVNNNSFNNLSVKSSGDFYFFRNSGNTNDVNFTNNSITGGFNKTVAGNDVYIYSATGSPTMGTAVVSGNTFQFITLTGNTNFYGFNHEPASQQLILSNNMLSDITTNGFYTYGVRLANPGSAAILNNTISGITGNNSVVGIHSSGMGVLSIHDNTISNLSISGALEVNGIYFQGDATNADIYRNRIFGLSCSSAGGAVKGIHIDGGWLVQVYNNTVGHLTSPVGMGPYKISGIAVSSPSVTFSRVYNNTIYINATSSAAIFGTAGIFHNANISAPINELDLRNNIIINESVAAGSGKTAAIMHTAPNVMNYTTTSNRNLLYAGVPSVSNVLMFNNVTGYQTLSAYQAVAWGADLNSFSGESFTYGTAGSFFMSLTGGDPGYLRPVGGITTHAESGASVITAPEISSDIAGAIRAGFAGYSGTGSFPDVGAYEFEGVTLMPVIAFNSITPSAPQCVSAAHVISVDIEPVSGSISAAYLLYTVNGIPATQIALNNTGGTTWQATIPAVTPGNATVTWGVYASNSAGYTAFYEGTPYTDEPVSNVVIVSSSPVICPGDYINSLEASATITPTPFSFTEGFEAWPPVDWTFEALGSSNSWMSASGFGVAHSGNGSMRYLFNDMVAGDAWGITPGQTFTAGTTYTISFWYKVFSDPEKLKVTIGSAADAASQTAVLWDNNGGTQLTNTSWAQGTITYTPAVSGTYYVGFNCYSAADMLMLYVDDISITSGDPLSYTWTSDPAGFSSTAQNPLSVGPHSASTTYTVTVSNGTCSSTGSLLVPMTTAPVVDAGADQSVCLGEPVTLTATGATTYGWSDGITNGVAFTPMATGTFTVIGTANGCNSVPDQVTVTVNDLPATPVITNNANGTYTSSGGTTYQWNDCGTGLPIAGQTSQTFVPVANGSYSVTVSNVQGCEATSACITVGNVGFGELDESSITVFPNPAGGVFFITLPEGKATVEVMDAKGKKLAVYTMDTLGQVDLSSYESGVYFLKVSMSAGSATQRVVKQ